MVALAFNVMSRQSWACEKSWIEKIKFNFFSKDIDWDKGIHERVVKLFNLNVETAKTFNMELKQKLDLRLDDVILGYISELVEEYFIALNENEQRSKFNETIKQVLKTLLPNNFEGCYDKILSGLQNKDAQIKGY